MALPYHTPRTPASSRERGSPTGQAVLQSRGERFVTDSRSPAPPCILSPMSPKIPVRSATLAFLLASAAMLAACGEPDGAPGTADLILHNGHIVTVDPDRPTAEALAIRGDRILAAGSDFEILELAGDGTESIDLRGATAVPGLIDAHLHFPRLGKRTETLFLDGTASPDEAIAVVAREVAEANPGDWITGQGWHTVYWNTQAYPGKAELNRVAPDNPVFLVGMASHAAWVNDRALELAGITGATADPPGGEIVRDPGTGEPTGILVETATDLVADALPAETRSSKKANIELSIETAVALGLTGVHDAGVGYEEIEIYKELLAEGKLKLRLYVMFLVPDAGPVLEEYISRPPEIGLGDHRLTMRSLKAYADGALGARGAALLEPYSDSPEAVGLIPNSPDEIYRLVQKAMSAGYQVAVHAIGDRGNRVVLDAMERAQRELSVADPRPRMSTHRWLPSPIFLGSASSA